MRASVPWLALAVAASLTAAATDPEPAGPPIPADLVEEVDVRLVLLDVVVVDRSGRTVADLTKDDFQIVVAGKAGEIDTLDVDCPVGGTEDPKGVRNPGNRDVPESPPGGRRIVLAFDYLHLGNLARTEVLDHARRLVVEGGTAGDEVMVAALTGSLRIEQPFTDDTDRTLAALKRMQYDITLWNGNFSHLNEGGWVGGIGALLDVLATIDGRKAIVLYSGMGDVPLDSAFTRIAAAAATARSTFYPVDANGLLAPYSSRTASPG